MKCENCGKISVHRFCSDKCRKSFSTKFDNKNETKDVECIKCNKLHKINKRATSLNYVCNSCNGFVENCKFCGKVKKNIQNIYCSISCGRNDNPNHISDDGKKRLSNIAKNRGLGGVRQSKRLMYNNKILGSSYELQLVKELDDNNIKWDTCKKFKYIDCFNKERSYTPDIYLVDYDVYLDPKNDFLIENINPTLGFKDIDKIKWVQEQNSIKIIILNKYQLNWEYIKVSLAQG